MRLDQWLWAVRLFKTRALAVEAIRGGRVKIEGNAVKPAREAKPGETVTLTLEGGRRIVHILGSPPSRVGAKLVPLYCEDRTPALPEDPTPPPARRERGAGRPTKRERRKLEAFTHPDDLPLPEDP